MAVDEKQWVRGRITDEGVAKMRRLIGYPNPTLGFDHNAPPFNTVAGPDVMRHFAHGYGDDNPLFCDAAYGAGTRWGGQVAPPIFYFTAMHDASPRVPPELKAETKGALRGVHLFHSGAEYFFHRPVMAGDRLRGAHTLVEVEEKTSSFSGGRSVITHNAATVVNQRGEVVATSTDWFVHTEREGSRDTGKNKGVALGRYTEEDTERIDAAYENEVVRGADTLWFEDVSVDDPLPEVVKGPMTVRDVVGWHIGAGFGGYGVAALKIDYKNRRRIPRFYGRNDWGAWDTMQRLHWEPQFAQSIGVPTAYDYGRMRECWLTHALTNWIGDDGWLHRVRGEIRKFNYVGDTTWIRGRVTATRVDDVLGPCVDVELSCVNQRDEVTVRGDATVLLPSRASGAVALPPVPPDIAERAASLLGATP